MREEGATTARLGAFSDGVMITIMVVALKAPDGPALAAVPPLWPNAYGTKAVAVADAQGRAVAFVLAPGQAHEAPLAPALLDGLPDSPPWIVGDRGLSSDSLREQVWDMGARLVIPVKRNAAPVRCPDFIYVHRSRIERLWARFKEWRAVATRYEKTACSFMGVLCFAAATDWLKETLGTQAIADPRTAVPAAIL